MKTTKSLRGLVILGLLAAATAFTGCRVSVGVGHGGRHSRNCYPQRVCDNWGCHTRRVCRGGWNVASVDAATEVQKNTQAWHEEFGISADAQKVLDNAFLLALTDNSAGLQDLGLTEKDAGRLTHFKMPTDESIQKLSARLDMSPTQGRKMIDFMLTSTKEQAQDINSGLWQECMDSGKWQTPENNACEKTFWKGCSPETGATMCIPAI